jgi:hypothetical protein
VETTCHEKSETDVRRGAAARTFAHTLDQRGGHLGSYSSAPNPPGLQGGWSSSAVRAAWRRVSSRAERPRLVAWVFHLGSSRGGLCVHWRHHCEVHSAEISLKGHLIASRRQGGAADDFRHSAERQGVAMRTKGDAHSLRSVAASDEQCASTFVRRSFRSTPGGSAPPVPGRSTPPSGGAVPGSRCPGPVRRRLRRAVSDQGECRGGTARSASSSYNPSAGRAPIDR